MKNKEPTPNYDLMFQSAVSALQSAYSEYKKAISEELRWTFFDNDGNYCFLDGYEKRRKRTESAKEEVARLMGLVNELRNKIGGDDG